MGTVVGPGGQVIYVPDDEEEIQKLLEELLGIAPSTALPSSLTLKSPTGSSSIFDPFGNIIATPTDFSVAGAGPPIAGGNFPTNPVLNQQHTTQVPSPDGTITFFTEWTWTGPINKWIKTNEWRQEAEVPVPVPVSEVGVGSAPPALTPVPGQPGLFFTPGGGIVSQAELDERLTIPEDKEFSPEDLIPLEGRPGWFINSKSNQVVFLGDPEEEQRRLDEERAFDVEQTAREREFTAEQNRLAQEAIAERAKVSEAAATKRANAQLSAAAADRALRAAEGAANRALDRELQASNFAFQGQENLLDRELSLTLELARQEFQGNENLLDRAFRQELQELDQDFRGTQNELDRLLQTQLQVDRFEHEDALREKELAFERQALFAQTLGTDPVRAVLLGLGVGGSLVPGGERFADLPPLQGAVQQQQATETALEGILGQGAETITIGETGIEGLPSVVKTATAFQRGRPAAKTLLGSAFGVGNLSTLPGISTESFLEQIGEVTPRGLLPF